MKFKANWFLDGKDVDLPDMKVEGALAVAELTKEHVDEFIPFVMTIQEEATLRLRVSALATIALSGNELTDDQTGAAKTVLRLYEIEPANGTKAFAEQCSDLYDKLTKELIVYAKKSARVSVVTAPFFLRRGLVEAFYMLKAYIWDEARKANTKPEMPFSQDGLEELIGDDELALFTRHSMGKVKKATEEASHDKDPESAEELKKKLTNTPE